MSQANLLRINLFSFVLLASAALSRPAWAEVTPHPLFCEGMVLQREADVPVWGWAKAGETVTVEFGGAR